MHRPKIKKYKYKYTRCFIVIFVCLLDIFIFDLPYDEYLNCIDNAIDNRLTNL